MIFSKPLNEFRRSQLHLPPIPFGMLYRRIDRTSTAILYGYSSVVIPKPANWGDRLQVTYYWYLAQPKNWQPSAALQDFLAAGSAPVYIGFGRMSGENPIQFTQMIVKALKQTGQRGILLTGWGVIARTDLPDHIFMSISLAGRE